MWIQLAHRTIIVIFLVFINELLVWVAFPMKLPTGNTYDITSFEVLHGWISENGFLASHCFRIGGFAAPTDPSPTPFRALCRRQPAF
jgi:hypothetical protein